MCYLARSTCVYAFSHASCPVLCVYVSCHVFPCFVHLLLYVDVRVTCSHACMMFLAMPCLDLCVFMPMFPCYRVRSLSSHAYMLGFTFFHVYVLVSTCLHACFYPYISQYMSPYAHMLRSMFFMCFTLSSMCLCAPCHVCVPRPRLCLSCHVLL